MQHFVIVFVILCHTFNGFHCENNNMKSSIGKLLEENVKKILTTTTVEPDKTLRPNSKPYEVFEDVSENVPLPYHIQKRLSKENKTMEALETAESRYVRVKSGNSYEVTENVKEIVQEQTEEEKIAPTRKVPPLEYRKPHVHLPKHQSPLHTDMYYDSEGITKEPITTLIVLQPISPNSNIYTPLFIRVSRPFFLVKRMFDHQEKYPPRIIENGNFEPEKLKTHHQDDDIQDNDGYEERQNAYHHNIDNSLSEKHKYESEIDDKYETNYIRVDENAKSSKHISGQSFGYLDHKQEPYVHVRRPYKHR